MSEFERVVCVIAGLSRYRIPQKVAREFVRELFECIAGDVLEGDEPFRTPIGTFFRATTKSRRIRNPQTGKLMTLPETWRLGFRASKFQKGRAS